MHVHIQIDILPTGRRRRKLSEKFYYRDEQKKPATQRQPESGFDYRVVKHLATLSMYGITTKEINLISFRGSKPKYDIRSWYEEGNTKKMGKGITLSSDEMSLLVQAYLEGGSNAETT